VSEEWHDATPEPIIALYTQNYCPDNSNCTNAQLHAKVFLENVNTNTGLMEDYLRTLSNFPLSDPFLNFPANNNLSPIHHVNTIPHPTLNPAVLAVTGNNAIVDWIFVELRDANNPSIVQYTRSGLLQSDGDIVDLDGVSPLAFPIALKCQDYYVTIRHRNHLGFRTANAVSLNTILNFTNNSVPLHGATPTTAKTPTISAMNGGDANSDGSVDAFDTIDWELQNGLFDDYLNTADYNFDGSVDAIDSITWELNNGKFEEID